MVSWWSVVSVSLNVLLLVSCVVFLLVKTALQATWWCFKTPFLFSFYFCIGVKNFVVHGKAAPPPGAADQGEGEEEEEGEGLFRRRSAAPPGPKREPGEGFTRELPKTTEECVSHLLANSAPYSVLCVSPDAHQLDIKKSYRQQAILVHPDKTSHQGADAAFKVLAQAFETIGDPERRQEFDAGLISPEEFAADVETMMTRLYEHYRDTLPCGACTRVHKITPMPGKPLTRHCSECNTDHPVKENDIWAETRYMGLYISYFACRNNLVYNVSEWIICQSIRIVPYTHQIQFALRNQNKTFDDVLREMEQDILGRAKKQQQKQQGENQPSSSSSKRRSRKKKKR